MLCSSSQEPRGGGNCPACSDATGGDVRRFSLPGWLLSSWPSEEPGPRNAWHLFAAVANNLLHQLPIEPFMSPQKVEDTTHTDATRQTCRHTAPRHVHTECPTDRHRETRCTSQILLEAPTLKRATGFTTSFFRSFQCSCELDHTMMDLEVQTHASGQEHADQQHHVSPFSGHGASSTYCSWTNCVCSRTLLVPRPLEKHQDAIQLCSPCSLSLYLPLNWCLARAQ